MGVWHRHAEYNWKNVPVRLQTRQPEFYESRKQYTGEDFGYDQLSVVSMG